MKNEDFGKKLFTILAHKLIREENPDVSEKNPDSAEEKLDFSEVNLEYSDSNDDVSLSVLMLSYACRRTFTNWFNEASKILVDAKEIPMIYVHAFEEIVFEKLYSPLKFLMLCSFISEIFLFVSDRLVLKKKHQYYLQQTTYALNDAFQRIFPQGFPQNGWTDIQNEASKLEETFECLKPFMNKATACQVAHSILTGNYEFENKQTDIIMAESPSRQTVNVDTSHCELSEPSSQVLGDIPVTEVPMYLPVDGLPTNQTAYVGQNVVYIPVSIEQTGNYEFDNKHQQSDIMVESPSQQMVNVDTSHCELSVPSSQNLGNISVTETTMDLPVDGLPTNQTADVAQNVVYIPVPPADQTGNYEFDNKHQQTDMFENPSQQMVNVDTSHCELSEPSSQVLMNIPVTEVPMDLHAGGLPTYQTTSVAQNLVYIFPTSFGTVDQDPELRNILHVPSYQNEAVVFENQPSGMEPNFPITVKTPDHLNVTSHAQENLTAGNPEDKQEPIIRTVKKTDNGESETCTTNNEAISNQKLTHYSSLYSRTESTLNTTDGSSQGLLENVSGCTNESISKEDNNLESETFSKDNILASANTDVAVGNQSEKFNERQSNTALEAFTTNEADFPQKNEAQQSTEIEINFQTDEKNLSMKILHLDLGGKKFVVRMPANISLIFKYNGHTSKAKYPENIDC